MKRTTRQTFFAVTLAGLCTVATAQDFMFSPFTGHPDDWFGEPEGIRIADNILSWQLDHGGWSKGIDMVASPYEEGKRKSIYPNGAGTIDNGYTVHPMRFLARAFLATGEERFKAGYLRGMDYLLAMQYPNGGWPQCFPLTGGYSDHITFNDDAMINAMDELGTALEYAFVAEPRKVAARDAIEKGIDVILRTQISVDGELTVWCQQHDQLTFEPRPARIYEKVSLCSAESVTNVRYLVSIPDDHPRHAEIHRAIEAALQWFGNVGIEDVKWAMVDGRYHVVAEPGNSLWARFYEIGTDRPIFSGRDGILRYSVDEIETERANGYAWYGSWPGGLLNALGK